MLSIFKYLIGSHQQTFKIVVIMISLYRWRNEVYRSQYEWPAFSHPMCQSWLLTPIYRIPMSLFLTQARESGKYLN